jgi:hypothetical protein
VDVVVEASTGRAYRRIEAELGALGLAHDTREGAPICRWVTPEGHVLDVMPTDPAALGFANRWYPAALADPRSVMIEEGLAIKIPEAPVYLATKWEAFHHRSGGDLLSSHDLEDLISVVAGRPAIIGEVQAAQPELREYLAVRAQDFLREELAPYAVQGALPDAIVIPDLVEVTLDRFSQLASAV